MLLAEQTALGSRAFLVYDLGIYLLPSQTPALPLRGIAWRGWWGNYAGNTC